MIKEFNDLDNIELYQILKLRNQIFVVEQNCIYQDVDDVDIKSFHVFIKDEEKIISYARIFYDDGIHLGRFLTKEEYRNMGYGEKLLKEAFIFINNKYPKSTLKIEAQAYLKKYYEVMGFVAKSDTYLLDGIEHIKMERKF